MTSSKPLDFEWESPETGDGIEASGNSVKLRRGDISAMVTRERNRMLDTTMTKSAASDGGQPRGSPFKALAESYGFRVISEADPNECQPEYESEAEPSEDESVTTANYSCFSDHDSDEQSEERTFIQGPVSSISDVSIHHNTRPYSGTRNPPPPRGLPTCVGKDCKRRLSQTVDFAREEPEPVVDELGTPRDPSVTQRGYTNTLPIHIQSTAIQRSLGSAFQPVLARTRVGYKTPENSKSPRTTYKVFSDKPGGNVKLQFPLSTPKTLWTRETNEYSSNNSTIIVSKQARAITNNSETRVDSGKDKQLVKKDDKNRDRPRDRDDALSLPEEERSKDDEFDGMERKPRGGMIYRLRDSKLAGNRKKTIGRTEQVTETKERRTDPRERRTDSARSTVKARRGPLQTESLFLNTEPKSAQLTISRATDSIAVVREYAGITKSPSRKRDSETAGNSWTNEKDVRQLCPLKEQLASTDPSLQPNTDSLTDCNSSAEKPHVDYKRNINSNYEEVEDCEEISASSFIGQYLYELWKNQCLCDVRIRVGKNSYMAHKIVLAAFSDVFCPNEPRKMPSLCFDIPNSTPDAVYQILLYLYTSEMELTDGILEEVLNAATFMGIWEVICLIKEILSKPTFENFVRYQEIRERQGMSTSLLNFPEIVREHLLELLNSPYFLQLTVEEMEALLKDPDILVESEGDVMQVIIKWIECDPNRRVKCASKLLNMVNFDCLPAEELFNIVDEKKHLFDMDAIQVFMEAFRNLALKQSEPKCDGPFNVPVQDRERTQQPNCPKQGQQVPTATCQAKFCNDKVAKSFKEIRDQFASQRQIEARHMLQRNTPNFTVEKMPRDQACMVQTKRKYLDRVPRCEGGDEKQMYDCVPRCPIMQQKPQAENWTMRTTCKLNDRKQLKTSPPSEDQFCGQKPRQVSFDACGWDEPECLCKSNKCSSAGGWSTTKGDQEDDTENEAEVQQGRRAVRRRGDIIRSCSSPCDTTSGSEKCGRKRVTFC